MIRHLFTLIWNRKKSNFLMITEIFFSFIVLFGVLSLAFFYLDNYRKPLGFEYDRVWVMNMRWNQEKPEEVRNIQYRLKQQLKSNPEVAQVALAASNIPYTMNTSNTGFNYNNRFTMADWFTVDKDFAEVMQVDVAAGRWFTTEDNAAGTKAIIINQALRNEIFPDENPVGKVIREKDNPDRKIVGVVEIFRQKGEYSSDKPGYFEYLNTDYASNGTAGGTLDNLMIRVKPGVTRAFEEKLMKQASQIAQGWTIEIKTMNEMRTSDNKITLIPLVIFSVVCGFLILNVALGLFGVLWYNINRRISEIGLRRAVGAASGQVYRQFIGEVLVLATFGIIIGIIIALQFPLLQVFGVQTGVYVAAILGSVLVIYLLAAGCAAYPSQQAASITPATALHEE
ncbi:ABC transporter permease [Adhaeribacter rhizoryzae]|uniref:FtsX-like permease family protein n=1 Tax=Adhaeribacter rhizoryzae TaxID=2607907 RepID=A0A5M6DFI7_9BACT|nr:ABC transporter permease [Adhaeribacter rhizoryzae]KAA5544949.1 FtsX-like permease family protein [Adhaeribacter rhizoryzae]